MLTLLSLLFGVALGAGGAAGWLLSEPTAGSQGSLDPQVRGGNVRERMQRALVEGERAGKETEDRLRRELDANRPQSVRR